jgi:hypothetical protein
MDGPAFGCRTARICCALTLKKRGPVTDTTQLPGPRCAVPMTVIVQALYACLARALSSALGGGVAGAGGADLSALQLLPLRGAGAHLQPLRSRQHLLRWEVCAIRRRESLRRAAVRYQRSRRGADRHAARQKAWRIRRRHKATHQGRSRNAVYGSVLRQPITMLEPTHAERLADTRTSQRTTPCARLTSPPPRSTRLLGRPDGGPSDCSLRTRYAAGG